MYIFVVIIVLVVIILVHELGHFSLAKLFGIRVDQFNIGFPPRLFKIQKGETLYSFNLLLLGGYVQIHGENPDDSAGAAPDPRALSSRARPVQAAVMLAGIAFNLVFAWLLLSAGYMAGLPTAAQHEGVGTVTNAQPMVVGLLPESPAQKAGVEAGDIIEQVQTGSAQLDVRTLNTDKKAAAIRTFIAAHAEESVVITVTRAGAEQTFLAKAEGGIVSGQKVVGIELADVGVLKLSPPLALYQGALFAKNIVTQTAQGLGAFIYNLVRGKPDFSQVSGPIGIVSVGGVAVHEGASAVLLLAASISIALALFNLLPIPGLDGGRLFIILLESIMRRPVPQRVSAALTVVGMALVLVLMLVVSYHDIAKLIG